MTPRLDVAQRVRRDAAVTPAMTASASVTVPKTFVIQWCLASLVDHIARSHRPWDIMPPDAHPRVGSR
ncbi:MAG: hypothetical protein M0Z36_10920, partial [Thermaerobacter sp.]|nr:hypothetical protein [Thermaerobacter sp.]